MSDACQSVVQRLAIRYHSIQDVLTSKRIVEDTSDAESVTDPERRGICDP